MNPKLILIGKITRPHGIRGQAKMISFADPKENIFNYKCLYDEKLNEYQIKFNGNYKEMFVISFNGNKSRNLVEEIVPLELFILRDMMEPLAEDEYYNVDLIGLRVLNNLNEEVGNVIAVHDFGAGNIIEMQFKDQKDSVFLPFNQEFILEINYQSKYIAYDFDNSGIAFIKDIKSKKNK